jgi:hypothetical protein
MPEYPSESNGNTQEAIDTTTYFHTVIEIAEAADEGSELQIQALDDAFSLATNIIELQRIAAVAPEGSIQKTRAINRAIILELNLGKSLITPEYFSNPD